MSKSHRLSANRLYWLAGAISLWACLSLPVFSQEAYYWTYAQHPDLSYYDHPPMVAWMIWLGTSVFGDGALGIRLGTWLCGIGTSWLGLLLLRHLDIGVAGQRLWVMLCIGVPALAVLRVLANPDPPLVFFMTLSLYAIYRARSGSGSWWLLAGVAAGAALLSKYTAAFLLVSGVLLLVFDRTYRNQLRRPWIYLGVVIAGAVFSPVVLWNLGNDFESFRFQTEGRFAHADMQVRWLAQLVGGQFGLLNPLVAVLVPATVLWMLRRWRSDHGALLLLAFALPLPLYMVTQSLWIQVKVNWLTPSYVPLMLAVVVWWTNSEFAIRKPKYAHVVAGALIWMQLCALAAPMVRLIPVGRGSSWAGWAEVAATAQRWQVALDAEDGQMGNSFYFAGDYRDAAQLGRELTLLRRQQGGDGGAGCAEAVMAQNVFGRPALQYDHWDHPQNHIGDSAVMILPRPDQRQGLFVEIRERFDSVEKVERLPIETLGIRLVDVDFYLCRGYRGPVKRP
jgi:hypothetical protein